MKFIIIYRTELGGSAGEQTFTPEAICDPVAFLLLMSCLLT